MSKLPASTGIDWLKQGFALFRKQPGTLTLLFFTNLLVSLLLSRIPLLGPILTVILLPSFAMAVMMACHLIGEDQRVTPAVLATGFRPPSLAALCKLGLVYLALFALLTLLIWLTVDEVLLRQVAQPINPKTQLVLAPGDTLAVLGISLLQLLVLMALCYAAPLTYWKKMPVAKAVFYSVFGVAGVARPMLVMLLAWFGMIMAVGVLFGVLAMINASLAGIVMGGMLMALGVVLQCAIFASYRQIFGDPGQDAAA